MCRLPSDRPFVDILVLSQINLQTRLVTAFIKRGTGSRSVTVGVCYRLLGGSHRHYRMVRNLAAFSDGVDRRLGPGNPEACR